MTVTQPFPPALKFQRPLSDQHVADLEKFSASATSSAVRLTILTQFYPPDFAATGQFVEELAQNLSNQAMDVTVFTGMPGYAYTEANAARQEIRSGVKVQRSRVSRWGDRHFLGRMLRGLLFCLRAALYLCLPSNRGDLLLFVSEPPYLQTLGYLMHVLFKIPYACLVYDLYPEVAIELGVVSENHWIVRFWNAVNKAVWQRASVIIVPSETMQERIVNRAPSVARKIVIIHNWADSTWIKPLPKQENAFAQEHHLVDTFTVLYSGNMGRCHDMDTILDAAQELKAENIQFVFIGGGPKREECMERVAALGLENCKFLPYQERSRLPQSLTACDLALVSIAPGMEGLVAPSKFYSALASGRPIAVICEAHSYLRQMVADARCGAAFSNGDGSGLAAFIRYLSNESAMKEQLGEAGHFYVAKNFTPQAISKQYQRVLQQAVLKNADLHQAILQKEFRLYFQPIFSFKTSQIQGFEVLLRWQQSFDQLLLPRDFLPRLEETGWIRDLTAWILEESAIQLKLWQETFPLAPQYLRINLSPQQFFDARLMHDLETCWFAQGLPGSSLGFDITETVLQQDPAAAIAILFQLRERGIQIYLDSFGSGVASLQSLHQFPLDGLALDRNLIRTIGTRRGYRSLIESLISLAADLSLPLHAEGIETPEQLKTLKSLGFQIGQGELLSPPVDRAIATQLLTENRQSLLDTPVWESEAERQNLDNQPLVLIVDDEKLIRKIFRRFLEHEGYRTAEAADAETALQLYAQLRPQIVLLDAMMPGMNGFDCCAALKQCDRAQSQPSSHSKLLVLLITSLEDEESVNRAFSAGADDYITKPINWPVLRQRLRRLLPPLAC